MSRLGPWNFVLIAAHSAIPMEIDLILLSRDESPPRRDVWEGIMAQQGVVLHVHRAIGRRWPSDANRWETIARARNAGKRLGTAPLVMLLDDDVVLDAGCMARLAEALRQRPEFAALGADCAAQMNDGRSHWDYPPHVGMAATLFRRERLASLTFRWENDKCECQCCCDDLRRAGCAIGYQPGAVAWHRPLPPQPTAAGSPQASAQADPPTVAPAGPGRILAAFNRGHFRKFRRYFLASLRASGNTEPVTAVTYGLYPSEQRRLAAMPGVEVVNRPDNGIHPAIRRLHSFQTVLANWPEDTAVAYWDAADILFQDRLAPLWKLVRTHPDALLAVREPLGYPENHVIAEWTQPIRDSQARRRAFDLLSRNPFLNSGFGAGTAGILIRYLRVADELRNSSALDGTADPGDQTALNIYCHTRPEAWREIPEVWNYCLAGRAASGFRTRPDGRVESLEGTPVTVVHGNAHTLPQRAVSPFLLAS